MTMKLACTMAAGRGETDLLLEQVASDLAARGLRCCGSVQINTGCADAGPCDMNVRVLPDGPVLRISQNLGRAARGCRLDPAALETAAGLTAARLAFGADILIVNKFGKHEAEGRGFRDPIARAIETGVPVLVGLNALNHPAFEAFTGGMATRLPPDPAALRDWVLGAAAKTGALI